MNDVRLDGVLYYIPHIRRFAIRIAGILLCGNIGIVYVSDPFPQKIHDCDMQSTCSQPICRYYHNPLVSDRGQHVGADPDIRNFVATSWIYRPCSIPRSRCNTGSDSVRGREDCRAQPSSSAPQDEHNAPREAMHFHKVSRGAGVPISDPKKMRKFASRATLDQDILTITSDDLSYYNEQIMHDILCAILMNYYVRKTPDGVS